jgi:hypothetical protein
MARCNQTDITVKVGDNVIQISGSPGPQGPPGTGSGTVDDNIYVSLLTLAEILNCENAVENYAVVTLSGGDSTTDANIIVEHYE